MRRALAALALALMVGAALAQPGAALVTGVNSAIELELATDDGRRVVAVLEGITPISTDGGFKSLKELAQGKRVIVAGESRGGEIHGTVYVPFEARTDRFFTCASLGCNEIDLRREQVRRGWARVSQTNADVDVLLKLEKAARDDNRGGWKK